MTRTLGSVRGAAGNGGPYRHPLIIALHGQRVFELIGTSRGRARLPGERGHVGLVEQPGELGRLLAVLATKNSEDLDARVGPAVGSAAPP